MVSNYTNNEQLTLIDGDDISTMGAQLIKVTGFIELPKRKAIIQHSWLDRHGLDVDLRNPVFDAKTPEMDLLVSGSSVQIMKNNAEAIMSVLSGAGLHYIKLPGLRAVYPCFIKDGISIERINRGTGRQHCRMQIKLIEPHPMKYMIEVKGNTVGLMLTVSNPVTILWGDGTQLVVATSGTSTKTYSSYAEGNYCIVVYPKNNISSISGTNIQII